MKPGSRLINLSSAGHRYSDVDLDDPNFDRTPYDPWVAYGRSKTANVLFAVEFDRRHKGNGLAATAVHPGGIRTELSRHLTPEMMQALIDRINATNAAAGEPAFSFKSVPQGAATTVWAAVVATAEEVGGRYCEDCHVAEIVADPAIRKGVKPYALDPEGARALWAKSEEMVGERF
jgi:NAD(P)-dependent dehydrogenase (short-subunit alcohol dehydrogenase family)